MQIHKFGLIGCGSIADTHARALREIPNAELAWVWSRNAEKARHFADKFGTRAAHTLEQEAASGEVQAVSIATASGAHLDGALPFLKAGIGVICEKPLEVTLERVDQMLETAQASGALFAGIFPMRLTPAAKALKAAMDAGRFGHLTAGSARIKWWRDPKYYATSDWKGTWALDGGGALMNQGIHAVDLLQWVMGMPVRVFGMHDALAHTSIEADDTTCAALRFGNGALGTIEATTSCYPGLDLRIEVSGDRGTAAIEGGHIDFWKFADEQPEDATIIETAGQSRITGGSSDPTVVQTEGHGTLFRDFIDCLEDKQRSPLIPAAEARKAIAIITGIYQSARSGMAIDLDD